MRQAKAEECKVRQGREQNRIKAKASESCDILAVTDAFCYGNILLSNRNLIDNSCFVGVDAADYCHAAGDELEENNRHMRQRLRSGACL